MNEAPFGECVPAAEMPPGVSAREDSAQMELFPELPEARRDVKNILGLEPGDMTTRFVAEYFLSHDATEAVLKSGSKCSKESARRIGSRLLTRVDIKLALAHLDKQIEESAVVSKLNIIQSVLDTRKKAEALNSVSGFRIVNECDRLLAQIRGMLRDKVEVSGDAVGSLAELKALVADAKKESQEVPQ